MALRPLRDFETLCKLQGFDVSTIGLEHRLFPLKQNFETLLEVSCEIMLCDDTRLGAGPTPAGIRKTWYAGRLILQRGPEKSRLTLHRDRVIPYNGGGPLPEKNSDAWRLDGEDFFQLVYGIRAACHDRGMHLLGDARSPGKRIPEPWQADALFLTEIDAASYAYLASRGDAHYSTACSRLPLFLSTARTIMDGKAFTKNPPEPTHTDAFTELFLSDDGIIDRMQSQLGRRAHMWVPARASHSPETIAAGQEEQLIAWAKGKLQDMALGTAPFRRSTIVIDLLLHQRKTAAQGIPRHI